MSEKDCQTIVCMIISIVMFCLFLHNWDQLEDLKDDESFGEFAAGFLTLVFAILFVFDLLALIPHSPIHVPVSVTCGSILAGLLVGNCYFLSVCELKKLDFGVLIVFDILLVVEFVLGPILGVIHPAGLLFILIVESVATWVLSQTLFKKNLTV